MGLDNLVADPSGDEETEDAVLVGEGDEDGEDDEMHDAFGVLTVVHCADAGDEAEQGGEAGVGFSGDWGGTVPERRRGGRRRRDRRMCTGQRQAGRQLRLNERRDRVRRRQQSRRHGCTPGREVCRNSGKRRYFHDQDGLSKSYQSPFLLKDNGSKDYKSLRGERGSRLWLNRACHPDVAAGGLAATGAWVRFGLFLIWLAGARVLIVRLLRAAGELD